MQMQMVSSELGEETRTIPKRFKCLHNFTLPSSLKWVSQRRTKAAATASSNAGVTGGGDRRSPASEPDESMLTRKRELESGRDLAANAGRSKKKRTTTVTPPRIDGGDGNCEDGYGIEAVRQKLMLDLKTAAERMKDAILRNEKEKEESEPPPPAVALPPPTPPVAVEKRWNLRSRRVEGKAPVAAVGCGKGLRIDEKKPSCSSPAARTDGGAVKLPKRRGNSGKSQRVKFCVELSKKEIAEDFMAMVGHPPPRKPNKRPRVVQKQLDTLFPGLWLTEVTANSYKIPKS